MTWDMRAQLPEKVQMLELLLRDGLQHAPKVIPTEAKLWFADQIIQAGYKLIEVTNFAHPIVKEIDGYLLEKFNISPYPFFLRV